MENAQSQLADKIKSSNNVLISVSRNPSVDQLSALLGLTLLLNKQGKHAAAVFSGEVPSTIEFLQPEDTFEKNTDSLRDFIIALDKSKADKLRYKVEDNVVRIFITPYKTSISQDDLEFSQGDFNVDVVVALGVQQQEDLDEAITAHGRILHDATVTSINVSADGGLGSINWNDPQASSLSELVTELSQTLGGQLDNQIATALLTGIVAQTERFSNDRTSSQTMSMSALLMAAGANQQLVASKLDEPEQAPEEDEDSSDNDVDSSDDDEPKTDDGVIEIEHEAGESAEPSNDESESKDDAEAEPAAEAPTIELPSPEEAAPAEPEQAAPPAEPAPEQSSAAVDAAPSTELSSTVPKELATEPPAMGGMLTANTQAEALGPAVDPLSMVNGGPEPAVLTRDSNAPTVEPLPADPANGPSATSDAAPTTPAWMPPTNDVTGVQTAGPAPTSEETLSQLEAEVGTARSEVDKALASASSEGAALPPVQALNAQPLGENLNQPAPASPDPSAPAAPDPSTPSSGAPTDTTVNPQAASPAAPPPVPPPIPFQFGTPPQQ